MNSTENTIYSLIDAYDNKSNHNKGKIVYHYSIYEDAQAKVLKGERQNNQNPSKAKYESRPIDWSIDFKEDSRHLPLTIGSCNDDEEYLVFKAKKRPVIILAEKEALDVSKIPEGVQRNKANNAFKKSFLVAPIFSCSHGDKVTSFGPFITSQVKAMLHDNLFYIPQHESKIILNPSIIRFDRIFWANNLNLNSSSIQLSKDTLNIIYFQLNVLFNLQSEKDSEIEEMINIVREVYISSI